MPGGRPGPASDPADLPHVYNPYAGVSYPSSYPVPSAVPPAGLGPDGAVGPARRPGALHLALVLLLVATLPSLLPGLLLALAPEQLTAVLDAQREQLRGQGVELPPAADLVPVLRAAGILLLVLGGVFALLALLAWAGRRWARTLVGALAVLWFVAAVGLVLLATAGQGVAPDAGSLLAIIGPPALALVGALLLFRPAARAWYGRVRP